MPRKVIVDGKGNVLNGKRYRDANTGIWYSVSKNGQRTPMDVGRSGKRIATKYIGGDENTSRATYWEQAPIMRHVVDSIAGRYGISGKLLKNRLNAEGFTDEQINFNNDEVKEYYEPSRRYNNYEVLTNPDYVIFRTGPSLFGLDDMGTYTEEGKAKPINENYYTGDFINEHGRLTNAASGRTQLDNIGLMASGIRYFQDLAKQRNPNNTDLQNSILANMYYHRGPYTTYKNTDEYDYTKRQTKKYGGLIHLDEL